MQWLEKNIENFDKVLQTAEPPLLTPHYPLPPPWSTPLRSALVLHLGRPSGRLKLVRSSWLSLKSQAPSLLANMTRLRVCVTMWQWHLLTVHLWVLTSVKVWWTWTVACKLLISWAWVWTAFKFPFLQQHGQKGNTRQRNSWLVKTPSTAALVGSSGWRGRNPSRCARRSTTAQGWLPCVVNAFFI